MQHEDWQQTFTGLKFDAFNPRVEDISIFDIAHSLSLKTRYGGMCDRHYSVAEHCCHLSDYFTATHFQQQALMHDAEEAYFLGDIPGPVKKFLPPEVLAVADRIGDVIAEKFGYDPKIAPEVKRADKLILSDEKKVLFHIQLPWVTDSEGLGIEIKCWSAQRANTEFLTRFGQLF